MLRDSCGASDRRFGYVALGEFDPDSRRRTALLNLRLWPTFVLRRLDRVGSGPRFLLHGGVLVSRNSRNSCKLGRPTLPEVCSLTGGGQEITLLERLVR